MRSVSIALLLALALPGCETTLLGHRVSITEVPEDPASPTAQELTRLFDANYPPRRELGIAYFTPLEATTVYFATDSDRLTAQARDGLEAAAVVIAARRPQEVVVEGYADERGNREYNLRLATRRALAARDHLASLGVDPAVMRVATFGIEAPVATCSTEACWRQNRRVTVVMQPEPEIDLD